MSLKSTAFRKLPAWVRRCLLVVVLGLWSASVMSGMGVLWVYAYGPGEASRAPYDWPENNLLQRRPGRLTLVMAAHPRCPCTRASIEQLAQIMRHGQEQMDASVLFFTPPAAAAGWEQTDLWTQASAVPGVAVYRDPGGALAQRFGAQTSGAVFVYDRAGEMVFHGGITPSRGHAGDNTGSDVIYLLLAGQSSPRTSTVVFGCRLHDGVCFDAPPAQAGCGHHGRPGGGHE